MEISAALIALIVVVVLVVLFLAKAIRIVPEYQRLVVFRLGRLLGQKGPGLEVLIPYAVPANRHELSSTGASASTCASSTWRSLGRIPSPRTTPRSRSTS